jgi:Tol biopolymer transport system component
LTFGGKNRAPIWSGNSWVVFQSDDSSGAGLFRQRADGSGTAERLTSAAAGVSHVPQSASPDEAHVLVTKVEAGRQSLWVLSLKDRGMVRFGDVQVPGPLQAVFSPDGRWVAYSAGPPPNAKQEDGATKAFVQPFPATGARFQIPDAIDGAARPVWTRSGDAILVGAGTGRDAAIPVVTAPRFEFGKPEVFPLGARLESPPGVRRNSDPVGDGRILGLMPSASDPSAVSPVPRIAVVLNWFEELRAKVR